jgi:putative membrane protein insertion efficiency factor
MISITGRALALGAIRAYQLTLSSVLGRHCRHLPSCSDYTAEAIARHGIWPGAWMGAARICRCGPFGTRGLDFVCEAVPDRAAWYLPWRYGRWRGTNIEAPIAGPSP